MVSGTSVWSRTACPGMEGRTGSAAGAVTSYRTPPVTGIYLPGPPVSGFVSAAGLRTVLSAIPAYSSASLLSGPIYPAGFVFLSFPLWDRDGFTIPGDDKVHTAILAKGVHDAPWHLVVAMCVHLDHVPIPRAVNFVLDAHPEFVLIVIRGRASIASMATTAVRRCGRGRSTRGVRDGVGGKFVGLEYQLVFGLRGWQSHSAAIMYADDHIIAAAAHIVRMVMVISSVGATR